MTPYPRHISQRMKVFFDSLSEKDRRRYAAIEAEKLGHGGIEYLAKVLGCDPKTIRQGEREVEQLPHDDAEGRVRKKKGGRPPASKAQPALVDKIQAIVRDHTAGDPMRPEVVWTYLLPAEIMRELERVGIQVCVDTVRGILASLGFHRHQAEKSVVMGVSPQRDEQFQNIAHLQRQYLASPNPILSMDSKKKEFLGDLFRAGSVYGTGANAVFDHDFPSSATGTIYPHGLYDVKRNAGHLTLGNSHDTSLFACDSLALWWRRHGRTHYPDATSLLLLCDGGGSNNCRHHIFKEDLQHLADRLGLRIRVAHYPPHCSKYNPIEHRLFPHVTRAWTGVIFRTLKIVTECLQRVGTRTGLKLTYAVLDKTYHLQRHASQAFLAACPLRFAKHLPQWNYTAIPC